MKAMLLATAFLVVISIISATKVLEEFSSLNVAQYSETMDLGGELVTNGNFEDGMHSCFWSYLSTMIKSWMEYIVSWRSSFFFVLTVPLYWTDEIDQI